MNKEVWRKYLFVEAFVKKTENRADVSDHHQSIPPFCDKYAASFMNKKIISIERGTFLCLFFRIFVLQQISIPPLYKTLI